MALAALRARPEFLAHCQEALASTRRQWLVQRFVLALTVGGAGGGPERRPIELQAHDPARCVRSRVLSLSRARAACQPRC